jgi:hypothetical protein
MIGKIPLPAVIVVVLAILVALVVLTQKEYRVSARWSTGVLELSPPAPPPAPSASAALAK